jgi:putative Holliday junction resolvase
MRIMAIDYGDAHTGAAVSDPTGLLAGYTETVDAYTPEKVIDGLLPIIRQYGVGELVLGCPKNMDGTEGPRALKSRAFADMLRERTGLPVVLWDERRTTIDAHHILYEQGKNAKKRKKCVDAVAASLILEGYLTRKSMEK